MATSLRKCPNCGQLMDSGLRVCQTCTQRSRDEAHGQWLQQRREAVTAARERKALQKTELCGVISLATAVEGLCVFPFITGPIAFVLGIVSLFRIANDKERLVGRDLAIMGTVLGALCTLWGAFGWLFVLGLLFGGSG